MLWKLNDNHSCCRWTRLRLTMELFPAIFEPLTESVVIGLLASWGVSYIWQFSAILVFIKHTLLWFILDYVLLRCVQGVSFFFLFQAHAFFSKLDTPCLLHLSGKNYLSLQACISQSFRKNVRRKSYF